VPVWAWGTGRNLIYGDGIRSPLIIVGLFFEGTALLLAFVLLAVLGQGGRGGGRG
jgi:hypothetical protein